MMDHDIPVVLIAKPGLFADAIEAVLRAEPGPHLLSVLSEPSAHPLPEDARVAILGTGSAEVSQVLRKLRRLKADLPVLVVAPRIGNEQVAELAREGAGGFIPLDAPTEQLLAAITKVHRGRAAFSNAAVDAVLRGLRNVRSQLGPNPLDDLTSREREVLQLVERGLSNKRIAADLDITVSTVKGHVHAILRKLDVRRRGEAAALFRDLRERSGA